MADKLKKNQRILNSEWDDETLSYREKLIERQRLEDEKRAQEERVRKEQAAASLDSFGSMQGMKQALDTPSPEPAPVEDPGYSIWDVGVSARQGAAAVTKGALGLPVNAANLIAAPFMDSPFQQPEFVRDMRGIIDEQQQDIYDRQASDKLKAKNQQFQDADGLWEASKFAVTNPGWLGLQGFQQGPQVIASGPGGVAQKVVTGALNAAGQSEEAVATELRKQGLSEEEIAKRSSSAFALSLALNAATPYALKSTFLEGLVARQAKNRVTNGVINDALGKVSRETAEGIVTEVGDQYIQNINSGKDPGEGLAQAAVLGAAFSAAVTGPTATIESAAEAGRAASKLQTYLKDQKSKKEATDLFNQTKPAPTPNTGTFGEQGDLFGGGGKAEPATTATPVEEADAVNQWQLRTKAATIRTQLAKDRSALSALQQRIERAPFAEEAADLLTNQERGDMQRLQARIPIQEQRLAEIESATVPIQSSLPLGEKRQPKSPKFTGEERTSEQLRSDYFKTQPVQGPAPMPPELRKEAQRTKVEELKRSKKEVTDADKKAKAQYEAARRKHLDGVRAGLMDLDPDTRASRLAEAAVTWKINNPLVLPSKQATTATTPAQNQSAAPVEGEATVPVSAIDDRLQAAPAASGALPSATSEGGTGVTLDDVSRAIGGGKRDKLASRLSYMVGDGNLEIVQDQADIPGDIGEMTVQGKGWFDPNTGKTYLVASNLDSNNTRGDILATLAHETKHAGDFGGSKGLAGSFKPFIGSKANSEMVEKIKKGAAAGDTSAQFALRSVAGGDYQSLGLTQDQANSELVANYLTAEHKKSGVKTSLYRGIVSPLRVGAKKLLGVKDVSLGDIHYMADRLVNEVAQRGERIKPSGGNALPMTISGGRTEAEQIRNNRTWLSADKKRKYEISDKDSSVEIPGDYMDRDFKAKEILKHDKLYNELPELADTTIRFAELDPSIGGQYSREDDVITINTATNEFKRGRNMYNGPIHQYILHEMQHRAQGVSGTTPGASQTFFLPNEAKRLENDIEDLAFAINYGQSTGADADFLERQRQEMSQKEQEYLQKYGPDTPAYEAATIQYEKVLGELEAYRTNSNLTKTEAELDETGLGQQEVEWDSQEGITTETGKRIRPTTRPRQKVAAMPQVVFHGTPHEVDKFSMDKIGTGEGAQAYGHGLYFASKREIADHYRLALSGEGYGVVKINGQQQVDDPDFGDLLVLEVDDRPTTTLRGAEGYEHMREWLRPILKNQYMGHKAQLALDYLDQSEEQGKAIEVPGKDLKGNLYKVDVPEDSELLDWDKPISEQPKKVRDGLAQIFDRVDESKTGEHAYRNLVEAAIKNKGFSGKIKLFLYGNRHADADAQRLASGMLLAVGIPGLRYLDGNSRRRGEGSANYVIWDENAISRPEDALERAPETKAKPMPSIVSKATPQDRRTMWTRVKDANTFIRTISNLVSTTDGYMTQVFQLLSNRSSDRATLAYDAERLGADMRDGIKHAAKEQGVSNAQIDEQLSNELEEINKLPTKEARDLAVKNLDNKYPGVGTALVAARNLKWDLARAVIVQRRAEGRDLTQKELNIINKMLDREETWTTRVYESGQPNAKALAKARVARYKKNPTSKEAKQHLEDIEYLRKHYVNIPPKEELLIMKAPALRNFYETWLGDADGVSEVDMVEALAALPKLEPAILQKKLDKVVRELIGLDKPQTKAARGFAGSRQNRTVLEGRQHVPPEIRRLMGEITGTAAKEILSIARLSSLYTQNKVLANLAANYKGILWEDYSVGEFAIPVTAENYGPMRGKFVTPSGSRVLQPIVDLGMNAEEALNTINENGATAIAKGIAAVGNKVQKLAGVTKIVSLILNLGAAGANYAGAWGALTANGVGVNKAVAAHKLTLKAIRARYKPNLYKDGDKKDVRDVILSGVLDSATTGEYQQRLFSTIFRDMAEDASPKDVMFKLYNLWNDGLLSAKDFYAFMDMWAKVGAWSDRREMLTKMYEADGTTKTEDEIIREAGHDITAANISWVRAPAIVKATEKYLGPFAMFLVYFAEVPRSVAFSYALVGKDLARANTLKTKEAKTLLRGAAVRRLVGTTLYISGVVAYMTSYLNGLEDDEERRRKTDPKWEQKGLNVVLGRTMEGQDITFNLLRMDFIGPLNELLVKLATQDEDDTTVGIFKEYVTDQFVKNRALFSLMRSIYSLAGKETINMKESDSELVKRLDDLSWGDDTNLGKNLADTVDKFTPAIVRGTINTIKGVTGSNDYKFSVADNPLAAFIQATGLKLTVRDPEKSLEFAVTAYNKEKKEAQKELSGIEKRFGRLTGSDLVNELDDVIEEERKAHKALHEVYDGVTAFNGYYTDKDYAAAARAVLKAEKLGPASSDIVSGSFNVRFVSKDYVTKWITARQEAIKELPTDKKSEASAALRADIKLVKDYLNSRSK